MSGSKRRPRQLTAEADGIPRNAAYLLGQDTCTSECHSEDMATVVGDLQIASDRRLSRQADLMPPLGRLLTRALATRGYSLLRWLSKSGERILQRPALPSSVVGKLPLDDEQSRAEEMKLVQRVFLPFGTPIPQVVVFSSVDYATGCTWICARAAQTLATLSQGTVCLVDANLRRPALHSYFSLKNNSGLTGAVTNPAPRCIKAQFLPKQNLWVLTSGRIPADPQALLTSDALRECMAELRASFNYVLVDAPPLAHCADAYLLGAIADGIVLVVEANCTRRETARRVKESLEAAQIPILAAVLNKCTRNVPDAVYRYL